jgi:hypothetical protein
LIVISKRPATAVAGRYRDIGFLRRNKRPENGPFAKESAMHRCVGTAVVLLGLGAWGAAGAEQGLRVATFNVDATPPVGSPVAYVPARSITDRLSARGIVLLGAGKPIVLCAVDWIGIAGSGQDLWRSELSRAAGTTPDRVAVHSLHQHDAPRCDPGAEEILAKLGLGGQFCDLAFLRDTVGRTAEAIRTAIPKARPLTHVGTGKAKVAKVASTRRVLGPDGKVKYVRYSSCRNPQVRDAPEGLIDPYVQTVSLWENERPLVVLSYYATHPLSYYGKGDVSADFVGMARSQREKALGGLLHVHFTGAAGNVTAGKYNDGSPANRPVLADRLAAGMAAAWKATVRRPIRPADVEWRAKPVQIPLGKHMDPKKFRAVLDDPKLDFKAKRWAATDFAWIARCAAGTPVELSCLRLGTIYILQMPGELFVEYQLAAQAMRPRDTVCMAAYGEYGTSYIGTEIAYGQGGYETGTDASHVAPETERILLPAIRELLQ